MKKARPLTAIENCIKAIAIERGGKYRGAKAELARRIDVTPQYVQKMLRTGHVPSERCKAIQMAVRGAVTAEELRPDIFCLTDQADQGNQKKEIA